MIDTFFSTGQLGGTRALFMAAVIGILFGWVLEQAGFGSSRRLSGVFYFRDMAVIKVMATAMVTAALGMTALVASGIISLDAVFLNPTLYRAQIIGGLIFGVGFVMGGWCPGTASVGAASGKWDAGVFLAGTVCGSILFNETFGLVAGLYSSEPPTISFVHDILRVPRNWFVLALTICGILVFWLVEWIEKQTVQADRFSGLRFLKQFSFILLVVGCGVFLIPEKAVTPEPELPVAPAVVNGGEKALLADIEEALDHMEPEELARRLTAGQTGILLVDIRSKKEFHTFHIRTARHVPLTDLTTVLLPHKNKGLIILYSNGMTHPVQARDALYRMGYRNVYILTDGLAGFVQRCLKPVSLRSEPVPVAAAAEINQWRVFFLSPPAGDAPPSPKMPAISYWRGY
ncbi:MAG: YeeE/YedE thiosulfate transporter family protein [Desulfotignum sp.]|nr:YeeE/YedE thiosulfate transporter family protein [Desulfotignum sp.]